MTRSSGARNLLELEARYVAVRRTQHLVAELLPAHSLALLVGNSGLGKSPLVYQLAMCVATGSPFLGRKVDHGSVLVRDFENGLQGIRDLCRSLQRHLNLTEIPGNEFKVWSFNDCEPGSESPNRIREMVGDLKPDLLIIDSLSGYTPQFEERNSNATQCLQGLRTLMKTADCSVVAVHHLRKLNDHPQAVPAYLADGDLHKWFQQVRGATAVVNGSDIRLGVEAPGGRARRDIALHLGGFARLYGELPLVSLSRRLDDNEAALGYVLMTGVKLLTEDQQETFTRLPAEFTFTEAKRAHEKGDESTKNFLRMCISVGILRQEKKGQPYTKVHA